MARRWPTLLWLPLARRYDELTMPEALPVFDFWKLHGTGNDFVVVEPRQLDADWPAVARAVCDRHFGVGADGLILVMPSDVADRRMAIYNADGSDGVMCGNGVRCFVKFLHDRGVVPAGDGPVTIETGVGVLQAMTTLDGDGKVARVRVAMGVPALEPAALGVQIEQAAPVLDLPLKAANEALSLTLVSMGNPHAVQFIDGPPADYELARIGPAVERHGLFANRTNFEVVRVVDRSTVEMRVWERGVGETLACGSGACAAAVASRLHGRVDDRVEVRLPGGSLNIEWDGSGEASLEGPAAFVFASRWGEPTEGVTA
jgi:diaminopimelate epimerase